MLKREGTQAFYILEKEGMQVKVDVSFTRARGSIQQRIATLVVGRFLWRWGWFIATAMLVTTISTAFLPDILTPPLYQATLMVQSPLPARFGVTATQSVPQSTTMLQSNSNVFYANFFVSPAVFNMVLAKNRGLQYSDLQLLVTAVPVIGTNVIQLNALGTTPQHATKLVEEVYDAAVIEPGVQRSGLIDDLTKALDTELIQARTNATDTFATLQTLQEQGLSFSSAYLQLYSMYRQQQQLVSNINRELLVLQQQGSVRTDILKLGSHSPAITTIPGNPPTLAQRLALSPLIGLLMGLSGALVADMFSQWLPLTGKKRALPPCITTIPELAGLSDHPLNVLKQTSPCFSLFQQLCHQAIAHERRLQVITIISPGYQEGKSIIAASLALAATQSGLQTLLIDAHPTHSVLREWFDLPVLPGTLDFVWGLADPNDPATISYSGERTPGVIQIGKIAIPARMPAESLPAKGLRSWIETLRSQADLLIIDGPALLSDANATNLALSSDLVLLVIDAHKSRRDAITDAERQLSTAGAPFTAILNRTGSEKAE